MFPHHECEIAQSTAALGHESVHYWMHNNMITINGQKMGKSLGNFITLDEFFTGSHEKLTQAYSPMTIRFFILQAHYRSTVDFSNEALQAAEKGLKRLMQAAAEVEGLKVDDVPASEEISKIRENVYEALCDDLNTPIALSNLFEAVRIVNTVADGKMKICAADRDILKELLKTVVGDVLGLVDEREQGGNEKVIDGLMEMILAYRKEAKMAKDWAKSDQIRDALGALGIEVKDTKDGSTWSLK